MTIDRNQIVAEQMIRAHVRKRIKAQVLQEYAQEKQLRKAIRRMILEAETGTEEPSGFTGINVLADLLKNIIPTIADDYKMLTTSEDQRQSFRNHIIHAVKNALRPIEVNNKAEDVAENIVYQIDKTLLEKVTMVVDDEEDESVAGEFIDIEDGEAADEDDFVKIADQNETGRNFAAITFKAIEKQIVDAYDVLADNQDQELFYEYLITNLLLYFDKFEDELQNELPNISTAEYEAKKETAPTETEEAPPEEDTATAEELGLVGAEA